MACPLPEERMKPLATRAFEGRVNPKGIPCLYCSTDMETAMTETRPWIGSYVSVAQFSVLGDLTVVDCTVDYTVELAELAATYRSYEVSEPPPEKRETAVWGRINEAFSEPVDRTDDTADYAPTQVLAETFRSGGYDGIIYGSNLGAGKTVALFDLAAAKQIDVRLYRVEGVTPKYSRVNEF